MLLFKIKLKTKAGNDVKNKQSFNIVFATSFKKNAITKVITGKYTYKIIYDKNVVDTGKVYLVKDSESLINDTDLTVKVILNLLILVKNICDKENINPDLIMLNSVDFSSPSCFRMQIYDAMSGNEPTKRTLTTLKLPMDYELFKLLRKLCASQQNTKFMCIDPNSDSIKYTKSLKICDTLIKRLYNL